MKTESKTYSSPAYEAFCAIEPGEYREKIRFIEKHRSVLHALETVEYLELMDAYSDALFEVAKYHKQIRVADEVIELSMQENVTSINGKDIYFDTLFKKAASLYNLEELDKSVYILLELLKMNPFHESSRLFLINCYVRKKTKSLQPLRAVSVAIILFSAFIIALELLFVRPFYTQYAGEVEFVRNAFLLFGILLLAGGEIWLRYVAVGKTVEFIAAVKKKKLQQQKQQDDE